MKSPSTTLGYCAAVATVLAAVLVPFVLYGAFTNAFAHLGLHVDDVYSGGPKLRSIPSDGYSIDVHQVVTPHLLQNEKPFVQLDWRPVKALPAHVDQFVDIDNDGRPDVRVIFDVPADAKAPIHADVLALNANYTSLHHVGKEHFSSLIVRVDDAILVRVPLAK